jgi:hypothetical protein
MISGGESPFNWVSASALVVSFVSLTASVYTLWLNHMHRGRLMMTQPAMIFFGDDGVERKPKIYLRTLLYSTSLKGHTIQSMFLKLTHPAGEWVFDFWACGEGNELSLGAGLYAGPKGVACNHHFLLRDDKIGEPFHFINGDYKIDVYAKTVNAPTEKLKTISLSVADSLDYEAIFNEVGIFFDWRADKEDYRARIGQIS